MKLERYKKDLIKLNVQVVPVSFGTITHSLKTKDRSNSDFRFVADVTGSFCKNLGLVDLKGHPFNDTNITRIGKMLVNSEGIVLWSYFTENNRLRLKSSSLVQTITKKIHP